MFKVLIQYFPHIKTFQPITSHLVSDWLVMFWCTTCAPSVFLTFTTPVVTPETGHFTAYSGSRQLADLRETPTIWDRNENPCTIG